MMMMAYDSFKPEIWEKSIQEALEKQMVMGSLVHKEFQGNIKEMGDRVNIINVGNVIVRDYTRGQSLTIDTLTDSLSTLLIDQQKYFAFRVDDMDQAQGNTSIMEAYTNRAATAIKEVIDTRLYGHYTEVASGNVIGSTTPIALTATNIYDQITTLAELLDANNVPAEGRSLVISPRAKTLLLRSSSFNRATAGGDEIVRQGRVGYVAGFEVFVSTNIPTLAGNVIPLLAFHKEFVTFASQVNKTEVVRPANEFSSVMRGLYLYGSRVLRPEAGAVLRVTIA